MIMDDRLNLSQSIILKVFLDHTLDKAIGNNHSLSTDWLELQQWIFKGCLTSSAVTRLLRCCHRPGDTPAPTAATLPRSPPYTEMVIQAIGKKHDPSVDVVSVGAGMTAKPRCREDMFP